MLIRRISFLLLFVIYQPLAHAMPFGTFDPRSLAMGGTGVSSGTSANAGYYNPALLAITRQDEDFSLEAPVLGLRLADPENLQDSLDAYQSANYEAKMTTAVDNFNTTPNTTNANAAATALTDLDNGIQSLSNKPLILEANLGVVIGVPSPDFGVAITSNMRALAGAQLNYTSQDSALINAYATEFAWVGAGNLPNTGDTNLYSGGQLRDLSDRLTSTIDVRGALVHETGVSIGTMVELGGIQLAMGITPKTVDVSTYDYSIGMQTAEIDKDKGKIEYSDSNIDLGIVAHLGSGFKFGIVGKNLVQRSYTTALGNEMVFKPQVRTGISHHTDMTTIALDVDVTQNDPLGIDEKTQYISAGAEINLIDTVQLRAGVKENRLATITNKDKVVQSIGLGFSPFGIHIDLAYAKSEAEKAASLQIGFRF